MKKKKIIFGIFHEVYHILTNYNARVMSKIGRDEEIYLILNVVLVILQLFVQ